MPTKAWVMELAVVGRATGRIYDEEHGRIFIPELVEWVNMYPSEKTAERHGSRFHSIPLYMLMKKYRDHLIVGKIGLSHRWGEIYVREAFFVDGCCWRCLRDAREHDVWPAPGERCAQSPQHTPFVLIAESRLRVFYDPRLVARQLKLL